MDQQHHISPRKASDSPSPWSLTREYPSFFLSFLPSVNSTKYLDLNQRRATRIARASSLRDDPLVSLVLDFDPWMITLTVFSSIYFELSGPGIFYKRSTFTSVDMSRRISALMETSSSCGMGEVVTMPKRNNDAMRVLKGGRCMVLGQVVAVVGNLVGTCFGGWKRCRRMEYLGDFEISFRTGLLLFMSPPSECT